MRSLRQRLRWWLFPGINLHARLRFHVLPSYFGQTRGKPLDVLDETVDKSPLVAADMIGAGVGETVIIVGGSSARNAAGDVSIPVDATVVGIVDDLEIDRSVL